jgi:hypothetical protein
MGQPVYPIRIRRQPAFNPPQNRANPKKLTRNHGTFTLADPHHDHLGNRFCRPLSNSSFIQTTSDNQSFKDEIDPRSSLYKPNNVTDKLAPTQRSQSILQFEVLWPESMKTSSPEPKLFRRKNGFVIRRVLRLRTLIKIEVRGLLVGIVRRSKALTCRTLSTTDTSSISPAKF